MKKRFCFILLIVPLFVHAQIKLPFYADSLFPTYYQQRVSHFQTLERSPSDIVFLGNSITDGAEWSELFKDGRIRNRGISGDISAGVIHRLPYLAKGRPAKIFLLIGVNDLARGTSPDSVVRNILLIADFLHEQTPSSRLYVQSLLPVNDAFGKFATHTNKGREIIMVNAMLEKNAIGHHYTFIDLHHWFCDGAGKLDAGFTNDGLHLTGGGYQLWKHILFPYVLDMQEKPALIPEPREIRWVSGYFWLNRCAGIAFGDSSLFREALFLQQDLERRGIRLPIVRDGADTGSYIRLKLGQAGGDKSGKEAYHLAVSSGGVLIEGNSADGIFAGGQTFMQLARDGAIIDGCSIMDWPAFSWRGYMVDVGRNFQSVQQLKEQIDQLGRYKLNVFHLHLTEDIAWRIAISRFPVLTASRNMLRDPGGYYSEKDILALMAYCEERHILFLPEIDMPGHSGAFTRATRLNMQTDSGLAAVKAILAELVATYHWRYIHIGGDEVHITNKGFLPAVLAYLDSLGVQAVGWDPGGNLSAGCFRQLWKGYGPIPDTAHILIDSRHLYLNHLDPLESVATIFQRQIGGVAAQTKQVVGATLCLWNDRAVASEKDLLRMNPVYPGMLAFAERAWRGGGNPGWVTGIGEPGTARAGAFKEFEDRLLDHRQENFEGLPFPYVRQSSMVWNLYGPFANGGDLSKVFGPERSGYTGMHEPAQRVAGGTVIFRHWWFPAVHGALDSAGENTTWYAATRIWSDKESVATCWIGFNDLSRSMAADAPPVGAWDDRGSRVWVNGTEIAPPLWKYGGQKGDMERPLVDEGYEFRPPTPVLFKSGWNDVLIKAPVGSFKGRDGQDPVKWMFTFVVI